MYGTNKRFTMNPGVSLLNINKLRYRIIKKNKNYECITKLQSVFQQISPNPSRGYKAKKIFYVRINNLKNKQTVPPS